MKWPTSRQVDSVENVAESMDSLLSAMLDQAQAWRAEIAAGADAKATRALPIYQRVAECRDFVASKVGVSPTALAAAYQRRFPTIDGFNPVSDWALAKAGLDDFVTWFQSAWPKLATGEVAAHRYGPTGQLVELSVTLTAGGRTALLAKLDALLAAFA